MAADAKSEPLFPPLPWYRTELGPLVAALAGWALFGFLGGCGDGTAPVPPPTGWTTAAVRTDDGAGYVFEVSRDGVPVGRYFRDGIGGDLVPLPLPVCERCSCLPSCACSSSACSSAGSSSPTGSPTASASTDRR